MEAFDAPLYLCAATLAEDGGGARSNSFRGSGRWLPGKRICVRGSVSSSFFEDFVAVLTAFKML